MSGRNRRASASAAFAELGVAHLVAAELEHLAADQADRRIVVDDQHARRLAPAALDQSRRHASRNAAGWIGNSSTSSAPAVEQVGATVRLRRRPSRRSCGCRDRARGSRAAASASGIAPATTASAGCSVARGRERGVDVVRDQHAVGRATSSRPLRSSARRGSSSTTSARAPSPRPRRRGGLDGARRRAVVRPWRTSRQREHELRAVRIAATRPRSGRRGPRRSCARSTGRAPVPPTRRLDAENGSKIRSRSLGRDRLAGVVDRDPDRVLRQRRAEHLDVDHAAGGREPDRVGQQVAEHLGQALGVAERSRCPRPTAPSTIVSCLAAAAAR